MRLFRHPPPEPLGNTALYARLGGLMLIALLHAGHLPLWVVLVTLSPLLWRTAAVRWRRLPLPPGWLLVPVALLGLYGVFREYYTFLGRDAGVATVLILAGCKSLETRQRRDANTLTALGYFLTFSLYLQTQALWMAAASIVMTVLFTAAQAAERIEGNFIRALGLASRLLAQAVPLMLVLFLFFPRIPGPLWKVPESRPANTSGISPRLAPGSISEMIESDAIAFRVQFRGRAPDVGLLYWRGPVMSEFDGSAWNARAQPPRPAQERGDERAPWVDYDLTLEPNPYPWVYALERVETASGDTQLTAADQVIETGNLDGRRRYRMQARLSRRRAQPLDDEERVRALQLPDSFDPQARAWGAQLARQYHSDAAIANAVMNRFADQHYFYSLQPPPLGRNWIDDFLFRSKTGFCEHYAGSMAFVMRAAGVPARVIGGYLGAERNTVGDYYIVRQEDAHAWTEVWLQGQGWVRMDPTAMVSPDRVSEGMSRFAANDATAPASLRQPPQWMETLSFAWDNAQNHWNQWVIGYDESQREQLIHHLGGRLDAQVVVAICLLLATLVTIVLAWLLRQGKAKRRHDPMLQHYLRLQRLLRGKGLPVQLGEAPRAYLQRAADSWPVAAALLEEFGERYLAGRYGAAPAADTNRRLAELRRRLRRLKR